MNITFSNGRPVVITPTWVDASGNAMATPANITLEIQNPSTRVVDNGNGSWTVIPAIYGEFSVVGRFNVNNVDTTEIAFSTALAVTVQAN